MARPSLQALGWIVPHEGRVREDLWRQLLPEGESECNTQHKDGSRGRRKVEAQIKRPWAAQKPQGREQPPGAEMLGEAPAPFQSRDKGWRFESLAVWSAGSESPSTTQASPWHPSASASAPWGKEAIILPATSAFQDLCYGPAGPWSWGRWGGGVGESSRGTCPQVGRGGVEY